MQECSNINSALYTTCKYKVSNKVISKLIKIGGQEILLQKNDCGNNSLLGYLFEINPYQIGSGLGFESYMSFDGVFFMLKKYIFAKLGEKFGIGGLLTLLLVVCDIKSMIDWNKFLSL